MLAIVGTYAASKARQLQHLQAIDELSRFVDVVRPGYARLIDDPDTLTAELRRDAEHAGVRLTITRPNGDVLADSEHHSAIQNLSHRPEIQLAERDGSGADIRTSTSASPTMLYYAVRQPVAMGGHVLIRAAGAFPTTHSSQLSIIRSIALAGALSAFISLLAVYIASRIHVGQIRRLSAGIDLFANGDLTSRIAVPGPPELAEVAVSLNSMAEHLESKISRLHAQEREEQAILQSMSNAVIAIGLDQRILSVNRAAEELLAISAASVRGRLLQEVIRQAELHRFVNQAFAQPHAIVREFTFQGEKLQTVQAVGQTLTDQDDRPQGLLIVFNDVTQLRQLEAMRSDFAANVSHELRTPITNLKGYVETLLEVGLSDTEQAQRFLNIVKQNCDRLAAIIEDVLALTKLEQPQTARTLEQERVNIRDTVLRVIRELEPAAVAKSITLEHDLQGALEVSGLPQLLEQAIGNLVSNAISYSPPQAKVLVRTELADEKVVISVIDDGPGIPAQHLPRLFERFYRVDRARSRQLGGTGLGLAIAKHISIVHGGRIEVESKVGKGSTFRIILPRRTEPAAGG